MTSVNNPLALPKILLVDDAKDVAVLFEQIFNDRYDLYYAASGEEALALLETLVPDLILLDLEMPGMGGIEFLQRKKAPQNAFEQPVVIVTVHEEKNFHVEALRAGAVDFIQKPFEPEIMLARIENQLQLAAAARALEASKAAADGANAARMRYLATMSHEVRTPLAAIIGGLELLGRTQLDAPQAKLLKMLMGSGHQMLLTINNVLDIAKIDAGKLILTESRFNVEALISDVVDILNAVSHKAAVTIESSCDDFSHGYLSDEIKIRQCLLNLAGNSLKFTEQGAVTVRARLLEDSSYDSLISFEVQDTGVGIAPGDIDRVFQPFEQVTESQSGQMGTGLGLSIVQQFVAALGGKINIESSLGQGTCFKFCLKLQKCDDSSTRPEIDGTLDPEAGLRAIGHGRIVLVADDEQINRLIVCDLLADYGLSLLEAVNGKEALDCVATRKVDLILLDLHMPVMDGIEAARRIRELPTGRELPILALTADAFTSINELKESGFSDALTKPIEPAVLVERLYFWLSKR